MNRYFVCLKMCFLSDFKLAEIAVNSNFYSWVVLCDELTHALAAEFSMQMWIHIESIFGRRPTWVNIMCVRKCVFFGDFKLAEIAATSKSNFLCWVCHGQCFKLIPAQVTLVHSWIFPCDELTSVLVPVLSWQMLNHTESISDGSLRELTRRGFSN